MERKLIVVLTLYFLALPLCAQSGLQDVLSLVERCNPQLVAARAELGAQRLSNKSEARLEGPELEVGQLYGKDGLGIRRDISVSQSFDIATVSGMKSRQVARQDSLAYLGFEAERTEVLLRAKSCFISLVHDTALLGELELHLDQARTLVDSYTKRLQAGDATVLDCNKAKMHLAAVQSEVAVVRLELQRLREDMRTLCGGEELPSLVYEYACADSLPSDFSYWYEETAVANPVLRFFKQEVAVSDGQLAIDKTAWAPKLSVGFMGEYRSVEKFSGVTLGVSVPLWSNSVKVKQAKARSVAARAREEAAGLELRSEYTKLFDEASALKELSEEMRQSLSETDNRIFLLSALSRGEISIIDYLVEVDLYYDLLAQTLAAERDYRLALARLLAVEL